ncbi:MAG: hypothetical protein KC422_05890 [Trueperaceae bacterium]|nr:hypothetical protein [Trueperaceae bacterium]
MNRLLEGKLETWVDSLSEGIIFFQAGRVRALNQAAATFLEIEKDQAINLPLIGVLRDHRLEQAFFQQESTELELSGRQLKVIPFENGLILRDISPIKRAEENARELLAVLSHELRTPVTVIRSTLEALQDDVPDKLRKRFMDRALTESERLVRLLEDLTVDVKPPQYRRIEIVSLVARAVNLLQNTFLKHGISFEERVENLRVWADADKLLQVLINLLENAAIHGPDNARVRLLVERNQGGFACIRVQDEGAPLDPATLERLFEPHARGPSVKAKGTGLGLYIVRNIANAWGGEAWAKPLADGNEFGVSIHLKD